MKNEIKIATTYYCDKCKKELLTLKDYNFISDYLLCFACYTDAKRILNEQFFKKVIK